MSLRARLVLVMLAVVAAGLIVANFATYSALQSFLTRRVDQQLSAAQEPVASVLFGANRVRFRDSTALRELPPGTYGELRDEEGDVVQRVVFTYADQSESPPELPEEMPGSGGRTLEPARFTTEATDGSLRYRVLAAPLEDGEGTLVVAVPLRDVGQTLSRLLRIQVIVTVAVLGALGFLSWWLVRLGLRPLSAMETTAGAIAAGNLSERVATDDTRTEVGRLGAALNEMLGRIEGAFAERRRSEDRLRQFVADASHELRTPLTSIRGYAELFRRGADQRPDDLAKAMRRIEEESIRMGVLVDDLLLLARLDEGRPLERQPLDLARLAADGVDDTRAVDPTRPVDLTRPDDAVAIMGDEARLRQVVANLLTNARTHTPADTPIHVTVGRNGDAAFVEVADEGPGLPPGTETNVFDRFFRAEESRSRAKGGSGLGLAIVAALAEAHGGRVAVRNSPGAGVAFRVELPCKGVSSADDEGI